MPNPTHVLVTGGAGYIGGATVRRLLRGGYRVTVLDDLSRGSREAVPAQARFVRGAVEDPAAVREALRDGVEACLHFASSIEAGESMRQAAAFFDNNTAGSLKLLRVLTEEGVGRFVLSSTAAVYGDPARVPIEEDDPREPTNAYGETKLLVERALAWMERVHGLRYAALRYFNAAGGLDDHGEDHDPETHLIPLLLRVAAGRSATATLFGQDYDTPDGTCIRDYVHVEDLAEAHVLALEALSDRTSLTCNLGNGRGFSVREVLESVRRVTGHPVPVTMGPRREGDPARLVASSERAREVLGWEPRRTDLDDVVGSAWAWERRRRPDGSGPAS